MEEVKKRFAEDWSSDQIAGRLAMEKAGKTISHETTYRYLHRELKREPGLRAHFRHPRRKRISRTGRKDLRGQIPDRVTIEKRPAIVDKKVGAGDREADSVEGAGKTGYMATFVDKMTKYLVAKVMRNKAAAMLNRAAVGAFKAVSGEPVKTLTVDNGKEFARYKELAGKLGCDIYVARPYHSWERGLNKHTNGLLRQYLPKKMAFDSLTQRQLDKIVYKINNCPRKSLGYRTPAEVFSSACLFALQI